MKELLTHIAKKILPHPDDVQVIEEVREDGSIHLTLITNDEDTGLAIGKGGKTAHALRELLKIKAIQDNTKIYVDIKSSTDAHAEGNDMADESDADTSTGSVESVEESA